MLFRVDAADPVTFVLAGMFLGAVTLLATWVPAFRATRIDPMSALRR
jgi:ABC-type antimicrobial peptide transport system permease subunit